MITVIDCASPTSAISTSLAQAGIRTVIRYYNHRNVSIKGKCLTRAEAEALHLAGLDIAVVFQQRGGAGGNISDLTAKTGARDATRAMALAQQIDQPEDSAIYFAVDWDFVGANELASIQDYFAAIQTVTAGRYRIGVYGSGLVCAMLLDADLAELAWLAQSTGWTDHQAFLKSQRWALAQGPTKTWPGSHIQYDPNMINPAFANFGQFSLSDTMQQRLISAAAGTRDIARPILRVIARGGLVLRRGPDQAYPRVRVMPPETLAFGLKKQGDWIQVDLDGDDRADGYAHSGYLEAVAGGFALEYPPNATPYQVARVELAQGVKEFPGPATNPRIFMYHASTAHGDSDSIPWCSSFVNFCVEAAGLKGTNSRAARSWHDQGWGDDATSSFAEGDIAVWQRRWSDKKGNPKSGGHVGFVVSANDQSVTVLGGNQSDRISIATYPREGTLGGQTYTLLSVRRAQI